MVRYLIAHISKNNRVYVLKLCRSVGQIKLHILTYFAFSKILRAASTRPLYVFGHGTIYRQRVRLTSSNFSQQIVLILSY